MLSKQPSNKKTGKGQQTMGGVECFDMSKELFELNFFIKGKNYSRRMSRNSTGQNKGRYSWKVTLG